VVQLAGDPLTAQAQARARRLAAQVRRAVATAIIVAVSHAALMPKLRLGSRPRPLLRLSTSISPVAAKPGVGRGVDGDAGGRRATRRHEADLV
jgi:hypothetical protein